MSRRNAVSSRRGCRRRSFARFAARSVKRALAAARRFGFGGFDAEDGGVRGRAARTSWRAERAVCCRDSAPVPAEVAKPERRAV